MAPACLATALPTRGRRWVGVLAAAGGVAVAVAVRAVPLAPYPHQAGFRAAGLALRGYPANTVWGAWNAGILSYFSGRPVVNLDGLTNDDLLPWIREGRLFAYLRARGITHIADFDVMLERPAFRRRGGYDDPRMDRCLRPGAVIDGGAPRWNFTRLRVREVLRDCG